MIKVVKGSSSVGACARVCARARMFVSVHPCACVCVYVYIHVCLYVCIACVFEFMFVYMCAFEDRSSTRLLKQMMKNNIRINHCQALLAVCG